MPTTLESTTMFKDFYGSESLTLPTNLDLVLTQLFTNPELLEQISQLPREASQYLQALVGTITAEAREAMLVLLNQVAASTLELRFGPPIAPGAAAVAAELNKKTTGAKIETKQATLTLIEKLQQLKASIIAQVITTQEAQVLSCEEDMEIGQKDIQTIQQIDITDDEQLAKNHRLAITAIGQRIQSTTERKRQLEKSLRNWWVRITQNQYSQAELLTNLV